MEFLFFIIFILFVGFILLLMFIGGLITLFSERKTAKNSEKLKVNTINQFSNEVRMQ
jgi:hypothetical protein